MDIMVRGALDNDLIEGRDDHDMDLPGDKRATLGRTIPEQDRLLHHVLSRQVVTSLHEIRKGSARAHVDMQEPDAMSGCALAYNRTI